MSDEMKVEHIRDWSKFLLYEAVTTETNIATGEVISTTEPLDYFYEVDNSRVRLVFNTSKFNIRGDPELSMLGIEERQTDLGYGYANHRTDYLNNTDAAESEEEASEEEDPSRRLQEEDPEAADTAAGDDSAPACDPEASEGCPDASEPAFQKVNPISSMLLVRPNVEYMEQLVESAYSSQPKVYYDSLEQMTTEQYLEY